MYNNKVIEEKFNNKDFPLEYKILEWRLILNRQLYEDKVIDLNIFSMAEKSILARMTRIMNQISKKDNKTNNF